MFSTSYPHFCQSIIYWMLTNQDSDVDIQLRLCYSQSLKPCELQNLILNDQFSFCWIYLLLLTLLTIRFSWPHSHHWASQGFHFTGLNPISLADPSRWPGEGRYPQNINWSLVFLRDRFLDPSSRFKVQGFFICHMINYTGYNQKWNVGQIRSAQWTVQRIKIK